MELAPFESCCSGVLMSTRGVGRAGYVFAWCSVCGAGVWRCRRGTRGTGLVVVWWNDGVIESPPPAQTPLNRVLITNSFHPRGVHVPRGMTKSTPHTFVVCGVLCLKLLGRR